MKGENRTARLDVSNVEAGTDWRAATCCGLPRLYLESIRRRARFSSRSYGRLPRWEPRGEGKGRLPCSGNVKGKRKKVHVRRIAILVGGDRQELRGEPGSLSPRGCCFPVCRPVSPSKIYTTVVLRVPMPIAGRASRSVLRVPAIA